MFPATTGATVYTMATKKKVHKFDKNKKKIETNYILWSLPLNVVKLYKKSIYSIVWEYNSFEEYTAILKDAVLCARPISK